MSLEIHLVVPGPITRISGGYIYDRRIMEGLVALGHRVVLHELPGSFPLVGDAEREAACSALGAMTGAQRVVIDALALPAFEGCLDRLPAPWLALVHHPLALEGGLEPDVAALLEARERSMLAQAGRIIVTSRRTELDVRGLGERMPAIAVIEPGTDRRPPARADGEPPTLLQVGALIPRKGPDLLLQALEGLMDRPWRLVLIGHTGRHPATTERVFRIIERSGMRARVRLEGEVDPGDLARAYVAADLFVLPSRHEGYGMALSEALAYGLPIVSTRAGAIPETVPEAAALLVPPGDVTALRSALRRVLEEPELRLRLRTGAREARRHLRSWREAAHALADELTTGPDR